MSGGRIPDEFIKDLLMRIDIVDLIDSHVPLKKTGANYVARCPFHTEKTPSFSVNRNKQFYHCFGCGASGNAIGFLMDFNHLNFVEAIEDLAAFAGIPIPKEHASNPAADKPDLNRLYQLMDQVAAYYATQLHTNQDGKKAAAYLKGRGIGRDIASEFLLGFAPRDWQGLAAHFDKQALFEAGMLVNKESGQFYDRFRDRVMFPIRDKRGRVIGFGGRVLDTALPKYLNSPETPLFHKSQEVYGLYELLQKNAKPKRIVLVEGYMDVIALAQSGFGSAVAALGTAVSQAHISLLFRFATELVLCFDGDNAGRAAAWRSMEAVFPNLKDGRQVRIMLLPPAHDPDSLVQSEGLDGFIGRLDEAQALSDYFFGHLLAGKVNLAEMEARAQLINKATPYLEKLPDGVFKDMMAAKLAELTNTTSNNPSGNKLKFKQNKTSAPQSSTLPIQRRVLALLIQNPALVQLVEEKDVDWIGLDFRGAEKFKQILQVVLEKRPESTAVLLEYFRNQPDEPIVKQLASLKFELQENFAAEFNGALDKLLEYDVNLKLDRILAKLGNNQALDISEMEQFQRLSKIRAKINI